MRLRREAAEFNRYIGDVMDAALESFFRLPKRDREHCLASFPPKITGRKVAA